MWNARGKTSKQNAPPVRVNDIITDTNTYTFEKKLSNDHDTLRCDKLANINLSTNRRQVFSSQIYLKNKKTSTYHLKKKKIAKIMKKLYIGDIEGNKLNFVSCYLMHTNAFPN